MLCVFIRIASMSRFLIEHIAYLYVRETRKAMSFMPPVLAIRLTLISSNYPCLKHLFMLPEVFETLKFDRVYLGVLLYIQVCV